MGRKHILGKRQNRTRVKKYLLEKRKLATKDRTATKRIGKNPEFYEIKITLASLQKKHKINVTKKSEKYAYLEDKKQRAGHL